MKASSRLQSGAILDKKKLSIPSTDLEPPKKIGPKTRSASTRREPEPLITYMGRARIYSENDIAENPKSKLRRPPRLAARPASAPTCKLDLTSSSNSSVESSAPSTSSVWMTCVDEVKSIGSVAKSESKYIRRLKMMMMRKKCGMEKEIANDENLAVLAIRMNTENNTWSLDSCCAYLPIIIEDIISENDKDRSIALDGLEAITATCLEMIIRFAEAPPNRIGVDVTAEDRSNKAKECIDYFRTIVEKRDFYYNQMDEESTYKLDAILEELKIV